MLPREMKAGRFADAPPQTIRTYRAEPPPHAGAVSRFVDTHFNHFNAAALKRAADAYITFIDRGGKMLVSLAGAMSTGELGKSLAAMIRADKVHAISCTGANLEEDLFNLVAHDAYTQIPEYHNLRPADDTRLAEQNINRVTDTGIPEQAAMTPIEEAVTKRWQAAYRTEQPVFPHEVLYDIIRSRELASSYQAKPADSWLVAAAAQHLPIVVPGWEDSTLGNVFAAECLKGTLEPWVVRGGIEYMMALAHWYEAESADHPLGFFQVGGGIPGDFAICVVPLLEQDMELKGVKKWQYFAQFTDADESMGGYSGALPTEKRSWGKLDNDTPSFVVKGDATIAVPLVFAKVLGW